MQKAHDPSKNQSWRNYPDITTPILAEELNRNETSVDTIDDRVVAMDTTKANQADLLTTLADVSFNSSNGKFTFTKKNGSTVEVDTDLEKLAINFDYDDDPTSAHYQQLIITLADGTVKYADLSALITQYEFTDSSQIHFTITNGVISATVIQGSITENMLQPNFLADCRTAKTGAETAQSGAEAQALVAEGYAKGTQNGQAVGPDSPYYHNNSKFFKDQAESIINIEDVAQAVAVNMIRYPYYATGGSSNGAHYTINTDGSVTVYTDPGGTTAQVNIAFVWNSSPMTIPDGDFICHDANDNLTDDIFITIAAHNKSDYSVNHVYGYSRTNGGKFTKSDGDSYYTSIIMYIKSGVIISQAITIKPMLEAGEVAHDFVPYIAPGTKLNEVVKNVSDSAVKQDSNNALAAMLKANATAMASLTTAQLRNVTISNTDLTPGTSPLAPGEIYIYYTT